MSQGLKVATFSFFAIRKIEESNVNSLLTGQRNRYLTWAKNLMLFKTGQDPVVTIGIRLAIASCDLTKRGIAVN